MLSEKPIIISTGAASIKEIKRSRNFFIKHNKKNVIYLHCTSIYPTPLYKANLRNISYLQSHITPLVGFSDHTESYEAASHATTLGAVLIEKHFTLDKNLTGPDHAFSSTPKEILLLKEHIKKATLLRGQLYKVIYPEEKKSALLGKRSLYKIDNKLLALRPRLKGLPKDSDFKVS